MLKKICALICTMMLIVLCVPCPVFAAESPEAQDVLIAGLNENFHDISINGNGADLSIHHNELEIEEYELFLGRVDEYVAGLKNDQNGNKYVGHIVAAADIEILDSVNTVIEESVNLMFDIGELPTDAQYRIFHLPASGDMEVLEPEVIDGKLICHFDSLSPVAIISITQDDGESGDGPILGIETDLSAIGVLIGIASVVTALGLILSKKH